MDVQPVDHLIAAVLLRDAGAAQELLAADPGLREARSMFGVGAVHAAHFTGATELLALLLPDGPQDVALAAELGAVDRVEAALAADPGLVTRFDGRGATALHSACYWGQRAVAEVLLTAGADPDAVTRDPFLGIRPLGSAVATTPGVPQPSDDEDVVLALVRLLLEHGADVTVRFKDSGGVCGICGLQRGSLRGDVIPCRERDRENAGHGENFRQGGGPLGEHFPVRISPMRRLDRFFVFHRALQYLRFAKREIRLPWHRLSIWPWYSLGLYQGQASAKAREQDIAP